MVSIIIVRWDRWSCETLPKQIKYNPNLVDNDKVLYGTFTIIKYNKIYKIIQFPILRCELTEINMYRLYYYAS